MYYGTTVKHGPTVKELTEFHNFCKKTCALVYTTPPLFLQKSNYCRIYKPSTDVGSPDVLVSFFSLLLIVKSRGELSIKVTHDVTG